MEEMTVNEIMEIAQGRPVCGCGLIGRSINFNSDCISHCCGFGNSREHTKICDFSGQAFPEEEYRRSCMKYTLQNLLEKGECSKCRLLSHTYLDFKFNIFNSISLNHFWRCNLKCNYCSNVARSEKKGKPYNIVPVLKELYQKGYMRKKTTVSWGGGEPSLYEHLEEALAFCKEIGSRQEIHSSGVLFSEPIANALKYNQSFIRISPDSGTPQTYKKIKGVDCFSTVWENIERYISFGKVVVKYIVSMDSLQDDDIYHFLEKCEEIGVDTIEITNEFHSYAEMAKNDETGKKRSIYVDVARRLYLGAKEKGIDARVFYWYGDDVRKIVCTS